MGNEKLQEVKAWLSKAGNDLRGAEVDLAADPPPEAEAYDSLALARAAVQAIRERLQAHLGFDDDTPD